MSVLDAPRAPERTARPRESSALLARTARPRESSALLARYAEHKDPADLEELTQRFRPLVRKLALRYARSAESLDDLEQIGFLGLVKALNRFDPARGFAFTSFAVPTILGELKRSFRDTAWSAHVPRAMQERLAELRKVGDAYASAHGRAPTVAELAERLDWSEEAVLDVLQAHGAMSPLSLDGRGSGHDDEEQPALGETLGTEDAGFELVDDRVAIASALTSLTPQQRRVIELRFGEDLKQSDIAQRIGCSQMQVSRLLRAGLDRLRTVAEHQSTVAG